MVTCPWCGTNYAAFQSNCQNCGGPIPAPGGNGMPGQETTSEDSLQMPPPPPRLISERYVRKLLMTDAWAIAAFVFVLLGAIFTVVGMALTIAIMTAFIGIPFAMLGLAFLAAGGAGAIWRYQEAQKMVGVLRIGEAVAGQVTQVEQNLQVRVNMRNPWVIRYQFYANGQTFDGKVSTFNMPGAALQPGKWVYVLYLPKAPDRNVLYPHP